MNEEITLEQISDKLKNRSVSLYKTFEFSIEDIQDHPEENIKKIQDYLNEFKLNFDDFEFHSKVDEATFKPMLTVQMLLSEEHRKHTVEQYEKFIEYLDSKNK